MKLIFYIFLVFQYISSNVIGNEFNSKVLSNNSSTYPLTPELKQILPITWRPPISTQPSPPLEKCSCGKRNGLKNNKIVGGTNADQGEFPWRCTLYSEIGGHICGCSIISNNWIMTAAHCTESIALTMTMKINIGDYDINDDSESPNQKNYPISLVVKHPSYMESSFLNNDISLIKLSSSIEFSRDVSPICLPFHLTDFDISGVLGVLSGWGTLNSGGQSPSILQKVEIPMLRTDECQNTPYGSFITENMICASAPNKDTCQGDSGGSMDMLDANYGQYYAMGIVSWGNGCAVPGFPGVYSKVTNFLQWIESTTRENFCKIS